jgi:hypothetical protein
MPAHSLTFNAPAPAGSTSRGLSKYGGQPGWLGAPQWPIVRETGEPMTFVMQFELPTEFRVGGHRVAYVFIDAAEDQEVYPCEAECGHNAVILQGGAAFEPFTMVASMATGPTLGETGPADGQSAVEGSITIAPARHGDTFPTCSMIGQEVEWLQGDETPKGGPWRLVLQAESEHVKCWVPFEGWLYIFVSEDGREARMLYQFT